VKQIPIELYQQIHQLMPIICVDIIVIVEDQILLVKRGLEPMKNQWWFPGGRLYRGEKLKEAAKRILKTEINANASDFTYLGYEETEFPTDPFGHGQGTHTINHIYQTTLQNTTIKLDKNHQDYIIIPKNQTSQMHPYVKKFVGIVQN